MPHRERLLDKGPTVQNNIEIERADSLVFYFPRYRFIDHVCGTMPSPSDSSVLLCCSAAFTGQLLKKFDHMNIAGNHVSGGVLYSGYSARSNTGCFAYYPDDDSWVFAMGNYYGYIKDAAKRKGCAFGQAMIILDGEVVVDKSKKDPISQNRKEMFRVLAEYKGRLCVIDAECSMSYGSFIKKLADTGVMNALYLDMGIGWNYSYYRDNIGQVHYIHDNKIPYTTNWIVFKK